MKRLSAVCFLSLFFFSACDTTEHTTFVIKDIPTDDCKECPKVIIEMPQAQPENEVASKINDKIEEFVIKTLNYSEENTADSLSSAIEIFRSEYTKLKERFPEEIIPWEATIRGEVSFQNEHFASIKVDSYIFTGGAHGYGSVNYLNFDISNGTHLNAEELLTDKKAFLSFAEKTFREKEDIAADANINSTGFMFESDRFHLPNSIGFDEKGIILVYNPYEIAAYADGLTKIEIPFEEAKAFIKPKWLEATTE
ncbi:DUF3298 and DUF4163 domain-containing protein [Galbibacter mesophilus]|uniref:DUF3298 and DUF4163 domain-containing protein n=1 Tax=Galbibacter mesophilus TaxID=379069 RepID=UPI00191F58BC|nr:DUF3298 and DUF4163 domain-containing protein [Galbibacter mesophilus]MCM5662447.1 DUF3298 and DUF4163 domain-containing protein [Galbibacter mesophilus]